MGNILTFSNWPTSAQQLTILEIFIEVCLQHAQGGGVLSPHTYTINCGYSSNPVHFVTCPYLQTDLWTTPTADSTGGCEQNKMSNNQLWFGWNTNLINWVRCWNILALHTDILLLDTSNVTFWLRGCSLCSWISSLNETLLPICLSLALQQKTVKLVKQNDGNPPRNQPSLDSNRQTLAAIFSLLALPKSQETAFC